MQRVDLHAPLTAGPQRIADAVARALVGPTTLVEPATLVEPTTLVEPFSGRACESGERVETPAVSPRPDGTLGGFDTVSQSETGSTNVSETGSTDVGETGSTDVKIGVAYSGGVDSTVLAALVARAIGDERTVLLLGVSPSLAKRERRLAHRQAEQLGLELVEVATNELANPDYAANPVDRCYHCKDELFTVLDSRVADELGLTAIAYGENADDAERPDRPGSRAAAEHRVLHPLAEAGATKADVRAIAVELGLASALKPAAPCLASRIPHGEPVTAEKLHAVDLAEDAVLAAGFSDCRVRHHGTIARIEVPGDEFHLVADADTRQQLLARVREAGFEHAALDLGGIQSGRFTLTLLSPGRERQRPAEAQ